MYEMLVLISKKIVTSSEISKYCFNIFCLYSYTKHNIYVYIQVKIAKGSPKNFSSTVLFYYRKYIY